MAWQSQVPFSRVLSPIELADPKHRIFSQLYLHFFICTRHEQLWLEETGSLMNDRSPEAEHELPMLPTLNEKNDIIEQDKKKIREVNPDLGSRQRPLNVLRA